MSNLPNNPTPLPGKGLFGWLGRQVGHVARAVKADVDKKTIYRAETVEEQSLPENPKVVLRRTTIDEIEVRKSSAGNPKQS